MAEYINKEEIIEFLKQTRKQLNINNCKDFHTRCSILLNLEQYINLLPIAKVKEAKQGFWVLETEPDGKPYCYHCLVCDKDFHYIGITKASDYCPNCGAEMINTNNIPEFKKENNKYILQFDNKEDSDYTKLLVKIGNIITEYSEKHELAMECGSEYIMQNDEAQVDALDLVCNMFDILSEDNKETE